MAQIEVRLGKGVDVDDAASIYERSNLARRQGRWPSRSARVAQVTAKLHDASDHDTASWFLIGRDGTEAVAMALIHSFRAGGRSGDVIAGTWFLSLIYVLPERWGTGIGGRLLDAVIDEAKRRGGHQLYLWTHEHQNERAHRLYRSRSFAPTGRTMHDEEGQLMVNGVTIANSREIVPEVHSCFVKPPGFRMVSAPAWSPDQVSVSAWCDK